MTQPPKVPNREYWTTNAHPHMEYSGVYVEWLEARLRERERQLGRACDTLLSIQMGIIRETPRSQATRSLTEIGDWQPMGDPT